MSLIQLRQWGVRTGVVLALAAVMVGCGSSDDTESAVNLDAYQDHIELAREAGCSGCHTTDGRSSYGPTWKGLYGTEITLDDGTERIADEEYIRTAITDPSAERRDDVRGTMPQNRLTGEEVDMLVELIQALGESAGTES